MAWPRSRSKYGAKKVLTAHGLFDSKGEAAWYHGLVLREMAGEISGLKRQVSMPLYARGVMERTHATHVSNLVLDATWYEGGVDDIQYADYKGSTKGRAMRDEARLKYKIFEANYGKAIRFFTPKGETKLHSRAPAGAAKKKGRSRVNEPAQAPAT